LVLIGATFVLDQYRALALGFPLAAVCTAVVIFYLAWGGGGFLRTILELRPLAWIGKISYSLYLWHVPFFTVAFHVYGIKNPLLIVLGTVLTFACAIASYYLVEQRFLALRPSHRDNRNLLMAEPRTEMRPSEPPVTDQLGGIFKQGLSTVAPGAGK
jgi:peptidoglycan/LPS O-acetylase OafA/YrhL